MSPTSNFGSAERPEIDMHERGRSERPSMVAPIDPDSARFAALPPKLLAAVEEAGRLGDAELVVETKRGRASIFASRGSIAWVAGARPDAKLSASLEERASLPRSLMRDTYRRCVESGSNFAETLILEGHARREDVRAALLEHNARQFEGLLEDEVVRVVVVPRTRVYSSDLVFSLEELEDARMKATEFPNPLPKSGRAVSSEESYDMADIKKSLEGVMQIEGSLACALVDWESGLTLGSAGNAGFDIELAASGNTDVVRAKVAVMRALGIEGGIEDMLITLSTQYHLIRPLSNAKSLFLYLAIDRQRGNLGMARHRLRAIEEALEF